MSETWKGIIAGLVAAPFIILMIWAFEPTPKKLEPTPTPKQARCECKVIQ